MALSCADEIYWYIYKKNPILFESIHWYLQFDCDPNWNSRKNKDIELDANFLF